MSDRVKIGPRIDEDLWNEFRDHVHERKGQVRGVLGDELENAIRNYIHYGPDRSQSQQIAELNERLHRIEHELGTAESDGGVDSRSTSTHTHAPSRLDVDERPPSNAATDKKVVYLAQCVLDREHTTADELQSVSRETLRKVVKDEYGFRSDTARRYVERLIDHFELREHPATDEVLVTPSKYRELTEQRQDDLDRAEGVDG